MDFQFIFAWILFVLNLSLVLSSMQVSIRNPRQVPNLPPAQGPLQVANQLPFQKPNQLPVQQLNQIPIQNPNQFPVQQLNQLPVQKPYQPPVQQLNPVPVQNPNRLPVQQINQLPVQQINQVPVQNPNRLPVQQLNQLPVQKPYQLPAQQFNQLPVQKPSQLPVQQLNQLPIQANVPNQTPGQVPNPALAQMPSKLPVPAANQLPVQIPNQPPIQVPNRFPVNMPNQPPATVANRPLNQNFDNAFNQLPVSNTNFNQSLMQPPNQFPSLVPNSGPLVLEITNANYKQLLFGSNIAWVLQFYNYDCSSCMEFQPYYERVADKTQNWASVIRFGRIDCKNELNVELCQMFKSDLVPAILLLPTGINEQYLIRYPILPQTFKNQSFDRVSEILPNLIVDFLTEYLPQSSPQLDIVNNLDVTNVWQSVAAPSGRIAIIFEATDSYLGRKVILGTLYLRQCVTVMRADATNVSLNNENGNTFLGMFDRQTGIQREEPDQESVDQYIQTIEKWVKNLNCKFARPRKFRAKQMTTRPSPAVINTNLDQVYVRDFENALYEFFFIELAYKAVIDQKKLSVLNAFIVCLFKYLPSRDELKFFLEELNVFLDEEKEGITYDQMRSKLLELQKDNINPLEHKEWLGCQGSQPHMRRYPCGLWTIFHSLTVNAFLLNKLETDFDMLEVLLAIRDFIDTFYSCADCVIHFTQMSRNLESEVNSREWSVLWLWQVHNRINKRMANETISNDPIHPKVQFPPPQLCPNCQKPCNGHPQQCLDPKWDHKEVMQFLLNYYSEETIFTNHRWAQQARQLEQKRIDQILSKEFVMDNNTGIGRHRRYLTQDQVDKHLNNKPATNNNVAGGRQHPHLTQEHVDQHFNNRPITNNNNAVGGQRQHLTQDQVDKHLNNKPATNNNVAGGRQHPHLTQEHVDQHFNNRPVTNNNNAAAGGQRQHLTQEQVDKHLSNKPVTNNNAAGGRQHPHLTQDRVDQHLNKFGAKDDTAAGRRQRRQLANSQYIKDTALHTYNIMPTLWLVYVVAMALVFSLYIMARIFIRALLTTNLKQ